MKAIKSNFCTVRRILHTYLSPALTHFPARDHYESYLHILGVKMKETYIFGQRFPEVNVSIEISGNKGRMLKDREENTDIY